jgi:glucosamine-phosphate N-acetyltransferase
MSLVIRPLRSSDYKAYLPLIQEFRPTEFSQEQFDSVRIALSQSGAVWVVEGEDGALIATATIFYEDKFIYNISRVAHVEDVCVSAAYRNTGIGKQLLAHLVDEARKKQCYKIILNCSHSVVGFYESCGFYKDGNQMTQRFES